MARPLRSGKQAVDLAMRGPKVSRIRRDPPPPPPKKITAGELRQREARMILAGLFAAALAIAIILVQIGQWAGWSPSDYRIVIQSAE